MTAFTEPAVAGGPLNDAHIQLPDATRILGYDDGLYHLLADERVADAHLQRGLYP